MDARPGPDPTSDFRSKVAYCRDLLDDLLAGIDPVETDAFPAPLRTLYLATMDAVRCGGRAGFVSMRPLAETLGELWAALRESGPIGARRVRSLLPHAVEMLENAARGETLGSTPERLCREFESALADASWADHEREIDCVTRSPATKMRSS